MKRAVMSIMGIMVFGLIPFLTLQVHAAPGGAPMAAQGMTAGQGAQKGDLKPQNTAPWTGTTGYWQRVPRPLLGKIYFWERYLIGHRQVLGLTEQQLDDIGSMLNAQRRFRIAKRADRRVLIMEIQELLVKGPVDLAKVEEKVKAAETISTDTVMEEIRTLEKVLSVLTPEQRKAVEEYMKESTFTWRIRAY
ncbi:MAG: hypothetical protein P8175_02880 [Deltaproteobacteria bacterium]|jgi:hypothetical protein